ncbi:hypothetical protein P171DRAFT_431447 [Karstenula rhodostoma CBS 690.94]|uniref:DUF7730 domain-containing protein n=1 Tax=Karstenula rhodostoma CBS 690.94 TaxID=1392251 RepID=A0A9P4PIF8_9PLEO|nr:hypothetical protein P171DRAFT_431447 [Karstenula rhodostoma CBS 690.94]
MHRLSTFRKLRNKVSQAVEMMNQVQSPLFGKLSAELRIPIYAAVLGDPERFLHICLNKKDKKNKKRRRLAHWRCTNLESPHPTWQHSCFGEERVLSPSGTFVTIHHRAVTTTEDQLLALLLSCRRIYSEALVILYEQNVFHFRGPITLPAFKQAIPAVQWNSIRKIHISTAYAPFYYPNNGVAGYKWLGSLPNWDQICEDLSGLSNLQSLSFDILMLDPYFESFPLKMGDPIAFLACLEPLKAVRAAKMVVELNMTLPGEVVNALGPVEYEVVFRDRPFNEMYRMWWSPWESIELEKL